MWPSALGVAAKLGSLLSLAFVLVGRRNWLKMSNSPMIKSVIFRELFDCLSVVCASEALMKLSDGSCFYLDPLGSGRCASHR